MKEKNRTDEEKGRGEDTRVRNGVGGRGAGDDTLLKLKEGRRGR